jgi:hypothetical protein
MSKNFDVFKNILHSRSFFYSCYSKRKELTKLRVAYHNNIVIKKKLKKGIIVIVIDKI